MRIGRVARQQQAEGRVVDLRGEQLMRSRAAKKACGREGEEDRGLA